MKRLLIVLLFAMPVIAQTQMEGAVQSHSTRNIEGSWELDIKSDPGPGAPPPLKALITFSAGGTVIETILLPPVVPAHGEWVQTGRGRYTFTIVHPLLDAGGNLSAIIRATSRVKVTSATEFTATFEGTLSDPNGNVIAPISGSETAKRITVE